MSTDKELGEAWFGCQAEVKHLKALKTQRNSHSYTQRVYSKSGKKRDETTKREEESR